MPSLNLTCINIPAPVYNEISMYGLIPPQYCNALTSFVKAHGLARLLLYGSSRTGEAVRKCIGQSFAGFIDTRSLGSANFTEVDGIVITTAPIHTQQIIEALQNSPLAHIPVITLFGSEEKRIRLILESQPRSGTHYTISNLQRSLNLGYASTFEFTGGKLSDDGYLFCSPDAKNGYVVKSHFTRPLHYPPYRYVPTLFLVSFFLDSYYKWARMLAPEPERKDYILTAARPEWSVVRGYIPLHRKWLRYVAERKYIRFEDYYLKFNDVMDILEELLGERPQGFVPPGNPEKRFYWSDDFPKRMDQDIQQELLKKFAESIEIFYPEKRYLLL